MPVRERRSTRPKKRFQPSPFPMLRHLPQPFDTGGLVGRVRLAGSDVDLARDGLVDDGPLLLLQQCNQLLLGADIAPDAPVGVVEEADDGGLFGEWWEAYIDQLEMLRPNLGSTCRCNAV